MDVDLIEKVARAMCVADGKSPDEHVTFLIADGRRWEKYKKRAKRQIVAFNTLMEHHSYTLCK